MSDYRAVSCASYDQWELWIIRKQPIRFVLRGEDQTQRGVPENLKTEDRSEFVLINGQWIRLDLFISAEAEV